MEKSEVGYHLLGMRGEVFTLSILPESDTIFKMSENSHKDQHKMPSGCQEICKWLKSFHPLQNIVKMDFLTITDTAVYPHEFFSLRRNKA